MLCSACCDRHLLNANHRLSVTHPQLPPFFPFPDCLFLDNTPSSQSDPPSRPSYLWTLRQPGRPSQRSGNCWCYPCHGGPPSSPPSPCPPGPDDRCLRCERIDQAIRAVDADEALHQSSGTISSQIADTVARALITPVARTATAAPVPVTTTASLSRPARLVHARGTTLSPSLVAQKSANLPLTAAGSCLFEIRESAPCVVGNSDSI